MYHPPKNDKAGFQVKVTLWFGPQKSWILSKLQLFQSFPTEVAQNDSEWAILPDLQLFQSFPTEVAQNDLEQPISPNSQLPIFSHRSGSE